MTTKENKHEPKASTEGRLYSIEVGGTPMHLYDNLKAAAVTAELYRFQRPVIREKAADGTPTKVFYLLGPDGLTRYCS